MSAAPSPLQLQQPKFRLGRAGEARAVHFLQKLNYKIVATNVRWKQLEIDIIAIDTQTQELVFVEVKTRSNTLFAAHTAISRKKMSALIRAGAIFMAKTNYSGRNRVDVITIEKSNLKHYSNVNWWR